jgi:hypothetical protein
MRKKGGIGKQYLSILELNKANKNQLFIRISQILLKETSRKRQIKNKIKTIVIRIKEIKIEIKIFKTEIKSDMQFKTKVPIKIFINQKENQIKWQETYWLKMIKQLQNI